jgi:hypothetical protein
LHGTASWLIRAQFTALRYFALDGTGPPQPQGTGQPVHHLANNHANDERPATWVFGQWVVPWVSSGPAFTQTTIVSPQTAVVKELPAALYWL